ncbi:WRKY transcription factor 22-like [Andrographis paniculata]|uniref:WRKY transcription factor 22-like n=1 Tax=Andrographis paniculata TaxID=175694 RepID=UPI0021E73D33|nr:WRKY transcription factor 22-like [Andrographis paniculata]
MAAAGMEDWSLQAIVRGPSGDLSKMSENQKVPFSDDVVSDSIHCRHGFDGEFLLSFPDELQDFYKPFYPAASADSLPAEAAGEFQQQNVGHDGKSDRSSETAAAAAAACVPKYKRRKNQHKREVIHVSAEGLASDMWAWRKYGQKPIKGSPYPRSYYRCSSSKGCLARKQVEQSCTDPGMYVITYTAEHSHSQPTRRNSLAGTVRQKFPSSKPKQEITIKQSPSSPKPPSVNDETTKFDQEDNLRGSDDLTYYDNHDFTIPGFVLNEDFFSGLEEFDDFVFGLQSQQLPLRSYS